MDLQFSFYAIPSLLEFLISISILVYILSKNLKKANKIFALFMFFIAAWSLTVFLQRISADYETALIFARLRYYFMIPIPLTLSYFTLTFPREKNMRLHKYPLAFLILFAILVIFLIPHMVGDVKLGYWGHHALFNPGYSQIFILFIIYLTLSFTYSIYNLIENYGGYSGANVSQSKQILIGSLLSLPLIIMSEILRMINVFLIPLTGIFFMPLALCVTYAMIKYKFLSIEPEFEEETKTESRFNLKKGNAYIIKEEKPKKSIEVFIDYLTHGHRGLCITRIKPEKLKKKYNLHKTPVIWMTDIEATEKSIKPTDIEELYTLVSDFIEKFDGSMILIQRLGYLINRNGYDRTLRFVQSLNDKIASSNCILLLSLNPCVLDTKQLKLLEQELIDPFESREVSTLPEHLHNLLEHIHKQNLARKPVAFKNISERFSISKNTTGQRIHELEQKGLVKVKKAGRYKMIFITEKGRKIFS